MRGENAKLGHVVVKLQNALVQAIGYERVRMLISGFPDDAKQGKNTKTPVFAFDERSEVSLADLAEQGIEPPPIIHEHVDDAKEAGE